MAELRDDLDLEHGSHLGDAVPPGGSPGKRSLTAGLPPSASSVAREVVRLMRKEERDGNGVAPGADALVGAASGASGEPLPDPVRAQFESSLGADLSGVRVHTGAESQAAAHAVSARAYTVGQDIHFGAGQYAPSDPFGLHLLAHEVAHTVQQSGGAARTAQLKHEVSTPGDAREAEADRAADAMVAGAPVAGRQRERTVGRRLEGAQRESRRRHAAVPAESDERRFRERHAQGHAAGWQARAAHARLDQRR